VIGKRLVRGTGSARWLAVGGAVACLVTGAFAAGLHFAGDGRAAHTPALRPGPEPSARPSTGPPSRPTGTRSRSCSTTASAASRVT